VEPERRTLVKPRPRRRWIRSVLSGVALAAAGVALTMAILAFGPYLAARHISDLATSSAFWAAAVPSCTPRCHLDAAAAVRVNGKLHWVSLGGPDQDRSYYQPGITIVYDASDPSRAMAAADYDAARSPVRLVIWGATAVAAAVVAAIAALRC